VSGIDRIGSTSRVTRDDPSAGHDQVAKADQQNAGLPLNAPAQKAALEPRNKKVEEVAKLYEKQFLGEMLKAMRGTVSYGEQTKPSMAENIYKDGLDSQYVESWGDNGGIGLSGMIYDQMMQRYFNSGPGKSLKQQGPIKLTDRDVSGVIRIKSTETPGQVPLRVEMKPSETGAPSQLKAPWAGEVVSRSLLDGKTSLVLDHGSGLKSTLIFHGIASADTEPGRRLEKGQTVGVLSPEVKSFFWNLNRTAQAATE
jgi:peptidoglycan hydrolase FlgJ